MGDASAAAAGAAAASEAAAGGMDAAEAVGGAVPDEIYNWAADQVSAFGVGVWVGGGARRLTSSSNQDTRRLNSSTHGTDTGVPPGEGAGGAPRRVLGECARYEGDFGSVCIYVYIYVCVYLCACAPRLEIQTFTHTYHNHTTPHIHIQRSPPPWTGPKSGSRG